MSYKVKIWAALRLGWIDKNYRLTEAGEEIATAMEPT